MGRFLTATSIAAGIIFTMPVMADEAMTCVQRALTDLGYAAGPVDGAIGGRTRAAAALLASEARLDLPELDAQTGAQWCAALTAFAETPEAELLQSPARSVIPGDILLRMPDIAAGAGEDVCGASNPANRPALALEPFDRITGFSSRMSNIDEVENAHELERFAGEFGGQAVAAYASGNVEAQAELVRLLAKWAEADALLGTESCVRGDGSLITSGVCTEWTVDDGSDPSGMKDATFVTFIGAGLVRAYYATLSNVMTDELAAEHEAIRTWIGKWADRLKNPGDVYFGLNMGWYWPTIAEEIAAGDLESARNRLQRIADTMIQLIRDDGSITDRTTRGNRALWYHFTSLGEVVMSMELMRAAGMTPPLALEEDLHKAVRLFIEAVQDHDTIDKWARVANNSIYDGTQDWDANWMDGNFAGTWLQAYPYRYAGVPEAEELRNLVGPKARSGREDIDLGLPLGCIYEAVARTNGLVAVKAPLAVTAPPMTANMVIATRTGDDGAFAEYNIMLSGIEYGDKERSSFSFNIYVDYTGSLDSPDVEYFRPTFNRLKLQDYESQVADYSSCKDIAVDADESRQLLHLNYGSASSNNACLLDKMMERDRAFSQSLYESLPSLLATSETDDGLRLAEMLEQIR